MHARHGSGHNVPELQLGHGAVNPHLQPPRHIPTPVSTSNSPSLRPGSDVHYYAPGSVTTLPLRPDSPDVNDSMTLDALANVAMMRRMSVKNNELALEEKSGRAEAPMEEDVNTSRGALGFILN